MSNNTTNDFVGIGIALEANTEANARATSAMQGVVDTIAKSFADLAKKFDPLTGALQVLNRGIGELNNKFSGMRSELLQNDNALKNSGVTWKQFMSERMSEYTKLEGSHSAAMKRMGAEWKTFKELQSTPIANVSMSISNMAQDSHVKAYTDRLKLESIAITEAAIKERAMTLRQISAGGINDSRSVLMSNVTANGASAQIDAYRKHQAELAAQEIRERKEIADAHVDSFKKMQEAREADLASAKAAAAKKYESEIIASYKQGGYQPVAGGYVKSSVDTKQSMDDAHAQAIKMSDAYNKLLPQIREYESYMKALAKQGKALWNGDEVSIQQYHRNLRAMNGEVKALTTAFDLLGSTMSQMFKRLAEFYSIRNIMFAVTGQIREAISGAMDFNQSIHDIIAISGESRESMAGIGDSILNIATHSRYTAKEVSELMQILAQAGVASKDLGEVSSAVGMFATATGAKPDQAADVVTTALNVYSLKSSEVTRATNSITAALNKSKLEVSGLATAFNYLAPQAAQLGKSMEETLGIIATMAQSGIKPSTIGTGVSQMMKEFTTPKARLTKLFEHYDINPDEVNPKLNSFADIVDKLKSKGVETEHLFQALESRVGRSVVAAVNLGGDAFRNMTDSVTGTSAAIIANDKAMEGAKARVNVLSQEFQKLVVHIGDALAPALSGILTGLTNLVKGIQTADGQVLSFGVGISALGGLVVWLGTTIKATMVATFTTFMATPMGIALIAVSALAAGFIYLGSASNDTVDKTKKAVDQQLASTESLQKTGDALRSAITDHQKYGKVQDETRAALVKLKLEHPKLLANIDLEKGGIKSLTEAYRLLNEERIGDQKGKIKEYNNINKTLKLEESKLATAQTDVNDSFNPGFAFVPGSPAYRLKKQQEIVDGVRGQFERLKTGIDYRYAKVNDNNELEFREPDVAKPEAVKPLNFAKGGTGGSTKEPVNMSNALNLVTQAFDKEITAGWVKQAKDRIAEAKEDIKDTTSIEDHQIAKETYIDELDKVVLAEVTAAETKARELIASKIGATYDASTKKYKWDSVNASEDKANYIKMRASFDAEEKRMMKEAADIAESSKSKAIATVPDFKAKKQGMHLISGFVEKSADTELRTEQATLALQKAQLWTAQEMHELDIKNTQLQLENLKKKEEAYQIDLDQLMLHGDLLNGDEEKYDGILAKMEAAIEKQKELNIVKAEQEKGLEGSFTKGTRGAYEKQIDVYGQTETLGAGLTNTAIDGMTNSLNGMVDALGRGGNAWQSFRQGLGNMLKDIANMLQQYVIKMLVVYAVQKMIGLVMGTASSGGDGGMVDVANAGTGDTAYEWSPPKFAQGGYVPLSAGQAGVDSVPAMLMPGEVVISKAAVDYYGVDKLMAVNGRRIQKFAEGGLVGGGNGTKSTDNSGKEFTLNIINVADPSSIPPSPINAQEVVNIVSFNAQQRGAIYKTIKGVMTGG